MVTQRSAYGNHALDSVGIPGLQMSKRHLMQDTQQLIAETRTFQVKKQWDNHLASSQIWAEQKLLT